jgi:hypothetical protein
MSAPAQLSTLVRCLVVMAAWIRFAPVVALAPGMETTDNSGL